MEPSSFSASASSPRQRAYFGSGAFAAYPPASRASDPFESHITSAMTLVAHGCCLLLPLMTQVHLRALQLHAGDDARLCACSIPPSFVCWRRGRAASVRRICSRHREKGGVRHHFEGHSRLCCLWVYQCMCFYQTIVVMTAAASQNAREAEPLTTPRNTYARRCMGCSGKGSGCACPGAVYMAHQCRGSVVIMLLNLIMLLYGCNPTPFYRREIWKTKVPLLLARSALCLSP